MTEINCVVEYHYENDMKIVIPGKCRPATDEVFHKIKDPDLYVKSMGALTHIMVVDRKTGALLGELCTECFTMLKASGQEMCVTCSLTGRNTGGKKVTYFLLGMDPIWKIDEDKHLGKDDTVFKYEYETEEQLQAFRDGMNVSAGYIETQEVEEYQLDLITRAWVIIDPDH